MQAGGKTPAAGGPLKCLCCMMTDPPLTETYHRGRDHRVGHTAGRPGCGRLMEACARRPCAAMRLLALRGVRAHARQSR